MRNDKYFRNIKKFYDISLKIFIVCGKNSFNLSGAKKIINETLIKTLNIFTKNEIPIYEELIESINQLIILN